MPIQQRGIESKRQQHKDMIPTWPVIILSENVYINQKSVIDKTDFYGNSTEDGIQ